MLFYFMSNLWELVRPDYLVNATDVNCLKYFSSSTLAYLATDFALLIVRFLHCVSWRLQDNLKKKIKRIARFNNVFEHSIAAQQDSVPLKRILRISVYRTVCAPCIGIFFPFRTTLRFAQYAWFERKIWTFSSERFSF